MQDAPRYANHTAPDGRTANMRKSNEDNIRQHRRYDSRRNEDQQTISGVITTTVEGIPKYEAHPSWYENAAAKAAPVTIAMTTAASRNFGRNRL